MSDSQEAKRERTAKAVEDSLRSAAGGRLWTSEDFDRASQFGLTPANIFVAGDRFTLNGVQDYTALGFANASPDAKLGLDQYLGSRGESLQDFQARSGALPLRFNDDGTATFDPAAQKVSLTYEGKSEWWETAVPIGFAAFAAAGLGGFLPGTESVFTAGATEAGIGAINSFDSGAMAEILGTNVASSGASSAAGLLAENSFDSGAMQAVLERGSSTLTLPAASTIVDAFKTTASVASSVGTIAGAAATIDAATGAKPVLSAPLPSANPLFINLGASDMATKTATAQPAATPAAQPLNLQSLLPIAVLVVAVLALGDLGE